MARDEDDPRPGGPDSEALFRQLVATLPPGTDCFVVFTHLPDGLGTDGAFSSFATLPPPLTYVLLKMLVDRYEAGETKPTELRRNQ